MPRRRSPEKRKVLPDPKYKDIIVAKFMNNLMKDGKRLFMVLSTESLLNQKKSHLRFS